MLKNIFFIILLTFLLSCQKDQKSSYKTAIFREGFPEILQPIEKSMPFKIESYSLLESNNDSIDIYVGFLRQGEQSGNWIALASNKQIKQFTTLNFKQDSENLKENDIDIKFNNAINRVSLRIKKIDPLKNNIIYSWMNQSLLTESLTVQTIDKPLVQGQIFPSIELTDIKGEKFDLNQLKGQTIVFNWWAVWCAPCRKEIPGLNKLVSKYSDKNVRFISVTDDSKDKVSDFLEKNKFEYDITFISEHDKVLFGNSYPINIIIDNNKNITFYKEGGNENVWLEMDQHLSKLNNKK